MKASCFSYFVGRALARVVVADARAERAAARHPHEADVVGRVELTRVDAAFEERERLAEEGHGHVAQGDADRVMVLSA